MDPKLSELGTTEASGGDARDAVPLTHLPTGRQARIVRVVHDHDGHWRKLSALGIVPGATVYLLQRFPTYAVRVGMSTIAVDTQLAQLIWVAPM
ncbi:MAG: ferrous iron transport protein A [Armatimonadetes bacterium]|nr:ferrous iron transport protein A [Armatimonadota bacterium]